jgi:hypothetical protein
MHVFSNKRREDRWDKTNSVWKKIGKGEREMDWALGLDHSARNKINALLFYLGKCMICRNRFPSERKSTTLFCVGILPLKSKNHYLIKIKIKLSELLY